MPRGWRLTGRDEELRLVDAALRRRDEPRGIVLAGLAGVGKTRLARESLDLGQARGAQTRWAVGSASARGLPLGAFASLLSTAVSEPAHSLRQAAAALMGEPGRAGTLIGVDDAHLLDDLSALLVNHLVLRTGASVVVTVRTGEQTPDAITALWKDGHLDRLEIQALSEPEGSELLEHVLGGQVDTLTATRLWALTRGNALYLRQLVEGELEAGRLRLVGDLWTWSGSLTVSPGLAAVVGERMGDLSEPQRDVVDLLALGEPLALPVLRQMVDPAVVEEGEERGLIEVTASRSHLEARLAHPLYGEARRDALGRLRTRRLHGRIAAALAGDDAQDGDLTLRRAQHLLESDLDPDPNLFTAAAHHALQLLDLMAAERLSRAAIDAGAGFDAKYTHAVALTWLSRGDECEREFAALAQLASTQQEQVIVALPRAANLFWGSGQPDAAEEVLASLMADLSDEQLRHQLRAEQSAFDAFLGRPDRAVEKAVDAFASPSLPPIAFMRATYGYVSGLGMLGRCDELGPVVSRAYELASQSFDHAMAVFGLCDLHTMALGLAGYVGEADRVALDVFLRGRELPGLAASLGTRVRGQAALVQGQVQTAIKLLLSAQVALASDKQGHLFRCQLHLTTALGMAGDAARAGQALRELEAIRHPSCVFAEPDVLLARAWVSAADGAISEATRLAREAAERAAALGQIAHEMNALHTAVRFGDRTVADRLQDLATRIDGPRALAAAQQAAALAADDGANLLEAAVRFEDMGDLLAAADAAAQAAGAHTRHGQQGAARSSAARAQRLREVCEGAQTPALAALATPLPLTDREREIVTLAAHGLSNREIADRLIVSVRTVEGHLYRACSKLGVSHRNELTALLGIT